MVAALFLIGAALVADAPIDCVPDPDLAQLRGLLQASITSGAQAKIGGVDPNKALWVLVEHSIALERRVCILESAAGKTSPAR